MRVLTVSRLCSTDRYKNIDLVIEAVKQLEFCTLTIVGDGDDRSRLEALASGNMRIAFTGNISDEDKNELYDWCDVFVLPSTKEGFGLVFIEAMQHGKVCIGANAGATPELLGRYEYGYLIEPDNLQDLKETLTKKIKYYKDAGPKDALAFFSYDRFKSRVKELLG